jgi:hypothetical protein
MVIKTTLIWGYGDDNHQFMGIFDGNIIRYLVGGAITILKNMSSSMGRMTTHI